MARLTLKFVKEHLKMEIEMFEMDFKDKSYGEMALLLHKHYTRILALLEKIE